MTIAVVLEGGTVQCVVSDDPADFGKEITVIDYDDEGADPSELSIVPQADGSDSDALVYDTYIEEATIDLSGIRKLPGQEIED